MVVVSFFTSGEGVGVVVVVSVCFICSAGGVVVVSVCFPLLCLYFVLVLAMLVVWAGGRFRFLRSCGGGALGLCGLWFLRRRRGGFRGALCHHWQCQGEHDKRLQDDSK